MIVAKSSFIVLPAVDVMLLPRSQGPCLKQRLTPRKTIIAIAYIHHFQKYLYKRTRNKQVFSATMSVLRSLPPRLDSQHGTGLVRAQQRQGFSSYTLSPLRRSRLPIPVAPRVSSPSSASTSPEKKSSDRKPQNSEDVGATSSATASFAVDPAAASRGDQPSRADPHIDALRARQHVSGGDFLVSERSSTCGGRIVVALDDTENAAVAVKWVAEHLFDPGARNAGHARGQALGKVGKQHTWQPAEVTA